MGDEEVRVWIERAEKDLNAARNSVKSGDYNWASFQVQQSVEKALKSLLIKKTASFFRTHDLVKLCEIIGVPDEIVVFCGKINPSYIETRYPDLLGEYSKEDAEEFVEMGRIILKWIKENL